MRSPIDFYFDFGSPYGYFASLHIEKVAAQAGREIRWHAILLGPIFKQTNGAPLTTLPVKGNYSVHDMKRTARFHNILFRFPDVFPIGTQHAARAVLWAQQHAPDKAVTLIHTLFSAYFTENIDISKAETVVRIAADLGLPQEALAAGISDDAIKNGLKEAVDTAFQRGVFGSPFVIVDDEQFWGFDRFDQLASFLKNGKI